MSCGTQIYNILLHKRVTIRADLLFVNGITHFNLKFQVHVSNPSISISVEQTIASNLVIYIFALGASSNFRAFSQDTFFLFVPFLRERGEKTSHFPT